MLQLFEDDDGRSFAQHESVAIFVERARLSSVVVAGAQGREQIEARHAERMDHAMRAAREHDVGFAGRIISVASPMA